MVYRDDGIQCNEIQTPVRRILWGRINHDLQESVKCSMTEVNLLDTTFNLEMALFRLSFKKVSTVRYVSTKSSQPPSLLKHFYKSIEAWLSTNSSNVDISNDAAIACQKALSGDNHITFERGGAVMRTTRK